MGLGILGMSCSKEKTSTPTPSPTDFFVYWSKPVDSAYPSHLGMPLQFRSDYVAFYADQNSDHGFVKFRDPESGALLATWSDFIPSGNYRGWNMESVQTEDGDLILSDEENFSIYRVGPPQQGQAPVTRWSYFFPEGIVRDDFAYEGNELFFAVNEFNTGSRQETSILRTSADLPNFDTVLKFYAEPGWQVQVFNPLVCTNSEGERLLIGKKIETASGQYRFGLVAYNLDLETVEWEVDSLESTATRTGGVVSEMIEENGVLYALGGSHLFALDVDQGDRLWTYIPGEIDVTFTEGSLLCSGDYVYAKAFDRELYCIDKSNGTQRWKVLIGSSHGKPITEFGNYIYHCREGLYAVHKNNGAVRTWMPPVGSRWFYQNPVFDPATGKMYLASATLIHCIQSLP